MTVRAWLRIIHFQSEHRGRRAIRDGIRNRLFQWLTGVLLTYARVFNAEVGVLSDPVALARKCAFALALRSLGLVRLIQVVFFGSGSRHPPDAPNRDRGLSRMVPNGNSDFPTVPRPMRAGGLL